MWANLRELYQYRALLLALTQRELKARYRASVLGFLWTFLNPTILMLVYTLLFRVYMRQAIPNYSYFLFVGLLPWTWFASSLAGSATSISDRRDLLTKVRFPAQVLPATVIVTNGINYVLSLPLMIGLGLFFGVVPGWQVVALPLVIAVQLALTLALGYLVAALNVRFRDLQFMVNNLILVWFFLTPVLYPVSAIPERYRPLVELGNPMAVVIDAYQSILYAQKLPAAGPLAVVALFSVALLWASARMFESRREEFAEYV